MDAAEGDSLPRSSDPGSDGEVVCSLMKSPYSGRAPHILVRVLHDLSADTTYRRGTESVHSESKYAPPIEAKTT